VEQAKKMKNNV